MFVVKYFTTVITMGLIESLSALGLSENESKIYLLLLRIGRGKVSEIAEKSGINREACYYVLNNLIKKGFVGEMQSLNYKEYVAIEPDRINALLEEEKISKQNIVDAILPELKRIHSSENLSKSDFRIYKGKEGFKILVSYILEHADSEICGYVSEKVLKFMPLITSIAVERRKKKNILLKVIAEDTDYTRKELKNNNTLREIIFSNITNDQDVAFYILEESLIILKAGENPYGLLLKDKSVVSVQKSIFNILWNNAKK